ncbi:MAG: polysaccharide deacetylase family protein [Bacteroidota bacterium]
MKEGKDLITDELLRYTIKRLFTIIDELADENLSIEIESQHILVKYKGHVINFKKPDFNDISLYVTTDKPVFYTQSEAGNYKIPVFFFDDKYAELTKIGDETIYIQFDILSIPILLLTRFEEMLISQRDAFDRFAFEHSISKKYELIALPIVDEYAFKLKSVLLALDPDLYLTESTFKLTLTHDIDFTRIGQSLKYFGRLQLDLLKREKNLLQTLSLGMKTVLSFIHHKIDICTDSVHRLIAISQKYKVDSEFYFMAAGKSQFNSGYNPAQGYLEKIYDRIKRSNMKIGIHFGFNTYLNKDLMLHEKKRLEHAVNQPISINRQHYLQIKPHVTIPNMHALGIQEDTTLGYAEQDGFRCGTCHPYSFFDLVANKELSIMIRPLLVMDVTLMDYKRYTIQEALERMKLLYSRCKSVGGEMMVLWHNTALISHPSWTTEVYEEFLSYYNADRDLTEKAV